MSEPQRTDAEKTPLPDWTRIRERFPVLEHKSYLNSCSYGAMSLDVAQAAQRYLDERMLKGVDWPDWVDHNEALRLGVPDVPRRSRATAVSRKYRSPAPSVAAIAVATRSR